MDNFKIIYNILKYIEKSMDYTEFDEDNFNHKTFKTTEERFFKLLNNLIKEGYIDGIRCEILLGGYKNIDIYDPVVTIKGMEYLEDNTMMKKVYKALKGIKEITPSI